MISDLQPGTYRPTTLRLASQRCPLAINHYQARRAIDRRIFGVGIAVHAIIQAVIEATNQLERQLDNGEFDTISMAVCKRMIRDGRSFEGEPEPPIPADDVWAGRELARKYVGRYPIDPAELYPIDPAELMSPYPVSEAEVGMAVDGDWNPIPYSKKARFRLIADYVTVTEEFDEDSSARVLIVRDYKSAWSTMADELDAVQQRSQAVLAWKFYGQNRKDDEQIDCLRQEVTNLRTLVTYRRDLWMVEDGRQQLERWQEEIETTMRALDGCRDDQGVYAASPGGGCIGCPFLAHCEPGKAWTDEALEHDTPEERAIAYVALLARAKALEAVLKQETDETPVRVPGGKMVGVVGKDGRAAVSDAWQQVLDEWTGRGGEPAGLIRALGIGVTQIDKVGKALFPERADVPARREWIASLCESKTTRQFGIHKDDVDLMAALRESLAQGAES